MPSLASLPKVHLHVHLESTVRPDTLREIADANAAPVPRHGMASFAGFRAFADYNAAIRRSLRRREDFQRVAREFCADESAHGTRYAELTFTAASHGERLGELAMPLDGVLAGLAEGQRTSDIEVRVLLDHSRRQSVDRARRTLELALDYASAGVIGIGAAGDESFSLAPFADVWDAARAAGLHVVHHAGENAGPASIREAIDVGRAERIGHGFRVIEDPELVTELRDRNIALEVCPSSNVALGLVASMADHPLPRLRAAGVAVTLSTDIPSIIGGSLTDEYARVVDAFGWDDAVAAELARAAVGASFASDGRKAQIAAAIDSWLAG